MLIFQGNKAARTWATAVMLVVASAPGFAATYAGSAAPYATFTNFTPPCAIGACANYNNTMNASGTITTAAPLPPNLSVQPIRPLLTAFTFTDGLTVYDSSDPSVRVRRADVSTDANGVVISADFLIQRWQAGGVHTAGDRLDQVRVASGSTTGLHDLFCNTVATVIDPDSCQSVNLDGSTSRADGPGVTFAAVAPAPAAPITPVPTLSTWVLFMLAGALALATSRSSFRRTGKKSNRMVITKRTDPI